MSDFIDRLNDEKEQLSERIGKLGVFCESENFQTLSQEHKSLLQIQLSSMKTYYEVLIQRLVLFMRGTPSN